MEGKAAGYNIQDLFRAVFFFNHVDRTHVARKLHEAVIDSKDDGTLFVLDGLDEVSQNFQEDKGIFQWLLYLLSSHHGARSSWTGGLAESSPYSGWALIDNGGRRSFSQPQ